MDCPLCGPDCRCSRSQKDAHVSVLIDPDHYDPSEELFAETVAPSHSSSDDLETASRARLAQLHPARRPGPDLGAKFAERELSAEEEFWRKPIPPEEPAGGEEEWRDEVASRVSHFRSRRGGRPQHSLSLNFEPATPDYAPVEPAPGTMYVPICPLPADPVAEEPPPMEGQVEAYGIVRSWPRTPEAERAALQLIAASRAVSVSEPRRRKIIEFPRSAVLFPDDENNPTELADPIFDKPRIFEADEVGQAA